MNKRYFLYYLLLFGKSTHENTWIPILRRISYDSIIIYKVRNSKEDLGLLGVKATDQPDHVTKFL